MNLILMAKIYDWIERVGWLVLCLYIISMPIIWITKSILFLFVLLGCSLYLIFWLIWHKYYIWKLFKIRGKREDETISEEEMEKVKDFLNKIFREVEK